MKFLTSLLRAFEPADEVYAHCDGPCGVYDPAQARVTAEAVVSMTKKLLALEMPAAGNTQAMLAYLNTAARYIQIKEQQAEETKHHLLVLWTDYFKPEHLEKYPDLHTIFWKAAKACSSAKQEVSLAHAQEMLDAVKKIHEMFWATKGRDVKWEPANP
ncbi:MAG: superoxide dismutase, Ni [Candidatus Kerfeldbacteria bacterium]|nr:superoxide dismutase, Ni [Candidatus Kerfeldbacteria bacterium]